MAWHANTGDHKVTRSDIFLVDPTALVVDWRKNLSRNGQEPPIDEALMQLARDMMPKQVSGDGEDGTSGQLNPILTRPLPDKRLEVVGGFRRMRAALWLIESGTCPDFKVKYSVSRMSDAEAALVNLSENVQREDPNPIQMAHAIRSLNEDFGLSFKAIAGRLKKPASWVSRVVDLVSLPSAIQTRVATGEIKVSAALELVKLPEAKQVATVESLEGEKVTAAKVRAKREKVDHTGNKPRKRNVRDILGFLLKRSDDGKNLANDLMEWIEGRYSDDGMIASWNLAFSCENNGERDDNEYDADSNE